MRNAVTKPDSTAAATGGGYISADNDSDLVEVADERGGAVDVASALRGFTGRRIEENETDDDLETCLMDTASISEVVVQLIKVSYLMIF